MLQVKKSGLTRTQLSSSSMVDPIDDITRQARQGSVAAIIQVLNEKLATSGVRTRAVLADGILQLLCEANTIEQLEQTPLVERIREILESLSPRSIHRVNINSRIVREQQLLWLEEISRDPENQLLWSQQIRLKKPNLLKRFSQDLQDRQSITTSSGAFPKTASTRQLREQREFRRGIVRGAAVSLLLLLLGWAAYRWWLEPKNVTSAPTGTPATPTAETPDSFVVAVRLAEQASAEGKVAKTRAQWLDLAAKWQKASDLMASVTSEDPRYQTAQNRKELYRKFSVMAQDKAVQQP